jgi:hypothetical protein
VLDSKLDALTIANTVETTAPPTCVMSQQKSFINADLDLSAAARANHDRSFNIRQWAKAIHGRAMRYTRSLRSCW